MDRYMPEEAIAKERLAGLPALVRFAWNMALIYPLLGDEIIADLCSDITAIVDRERGRVTEAAEAAAAAKASQFWFERVSRSEARARERLAAMVTASPDGLYPHSYYVYLLWPSRDAEKPVYVGRSSNVLSRLGQHMNDPEKRYATAWVTMIDCVTEPAMVETEERLITHYRPDLNIAGNSRYHV